MFRSVLRQCFDWPDPRSHLGGRLGGAIFSRLLIGGVRSRPTTRVGRAQRCTASPPGIVAREVCKSYGDHVVLDRVGLTAPEGTILALLGPNGAGKTTMVRILSTLISADAGSMRVAGYDVVGDPDGVRSAIGVTGQFSAVDNLLTGAENLQMMAELRHLGRAAARHRVAELLERFELTDAAGKLASTYSGGMRRQLDLAMTLVGEPRVIFLDEPTTGLDPRSRLRMWEHIRQLAAGGATILLTTQYLDEADQLADQIAVLDQGHIVAEGTPDELKRRVPGGHVRLHFSEPALLASASALLPAAVAEPDQLVLQVAGDESVDSLRALLDELHEARIDVARLSIHTADLDDVFLAVTARRTRQAAEDVVDAGNPASDKERSHP
jgi:ABC-2 type transport system ATP-binding protein